MNVLRVLKIALGVSIVVFTIAGASVSFVIFDRQKALQEVSRYNTVWAVSQATGEFYRFETRVSQFAAGGGIDKSEVQLRFDILNNRLDVFAKGDVKQFADAGADRSETIAAFGKLLPQLEPLVQQLEVPGNAQRILELSQPFEGKLAHLAASANQYGGDLTAEDQRHLMVLHWIFSGIATALVLCGLAFIVLLFMQNRLLARAYNALSDLADDLRVAKNAADAASQAKSRFLATMSHELRTPLNAVIGFSEIIATEAFGPAGQPAYRDYAADIQNSGEHMLELVNDILTTAKLDAGHLELELAPMDPLRTTERTVTMFRGTRYARDHTITVAADMAWPRIEADERAYRQMLLNLLSNAAKFSEPGTPIEVRCTKAENGVLITVCDQGIGMTPQEVARVTQPFYQADGRLARKYEGSGLGLTIVAGLMKCHGGELLIESYPGAGSQISLVFPASVAAAESLAAAA